MKRSFLASVAVILLHTQNVSGQDIAQAQLPSLLVNNFQKTFPKASDVEWEQEGSLYKVEFETDLFGADHHAWYTPTGKLVRHQEEIGKGDLPQTVRTKLSKEFSAYSVDDVDKITEAGKTTYRLELKTFGAEWKVTFDTAGNVLARIAD